MTDEQETLVTLSKMALYESIDFYSLPNAQDIIDLEQFAPPVLKPLDHIGEKFCVLDYDVMRGEDDKQYLLVTVFDPTNNEVCLMSTGSSLAMPAIIAIIDNSDNGGWIYFETVGRTYKVVGCTPPK